MINNLLKQQTTRIPGIQPSTDCISQPVFANVYVPSPVDINSHELTKFPACVNPQETDNSNINYLAHVNRINTSEESVQPAFSADNQNDLVFVILPEELNTSSSIGTNITTVDNHQAAPVVGSADFQVSTTTDDIVFSSYNTSSTVAINNNFTTSTVATNPSINVSVAMPEQPPETQLVASEGGYDGTEIQLQFDKNDQKIMEATMKAFESGSLTPLIKEELRCTIQSRRLAEGKGELQVEFKTPLKRKDVTEDERKRAVKRRLQNREAAQRFRQRQKDTSDYLTTKIKRLEKNSNVLIKDLNRLKVERDELRKMLEDHLVVCTNHVHCPQTDDGFDVEQFLRGLSTPNTTIASLPEPTPPCPDTGDSTCSSVFFPDETSDFHNLQAAEQPVGFADELTYMENVVQDLNGAPDVCYEEIVIDMDQTDTGSEYSDDQRLDSCSSVEVASNYGSVSSDIYSLSDSTSELRHSLTSAYSRVHMNSCSSEPFEATFVEDLFLIDDITP